MEWLEETYGHRSEEYIDAQCSDDYGGTCMLPEGHRGPHEFTPDSEIVVVFCGDDNAAS
jgi:hypothetical protein